MTPVLGADIEVQVGDWQEAIRASCQSLLAAGAVEERYVDRCVEMVVEQGPYIVVVPGIALAHARPEDGVHELALSVVSLAKPVGFGHPDNDPVDLVFAFASPDREQHVQLLAAIANALGNGLADSIRTSKSADEALALLESALVHV